MAHHFVDLGVLEIGHGHEFVIFNSGEHRVEVAGVLWSRLVAEVWVSWMMKNGLSRERKAWWEKY